ncbi:hypothetical protein GYB59_17580 [bacterium]|nr:hypothetical protein [bacterium]
MRIRATKRHRSEIAEPFRPFIPDPANVTIGKDYEVHGIVFYNWGEYLQPQQFVQMPGIADLQIVDDLGYPAWYPCCLFEIVDGAFPSDWQSNLFSHNDIQGPMVVIGPEFLVRSEEAYQAMVELDADQVDRFWKRLDSVSTADET